MKILQYSKNERPSMPETAYIADVMRREHIKKIVLTTDDIGRNLEWNWGKVLPSDVGKICILVDNRDFYMENTDQMNKRLSKGA